MNQFAEAFGFTWIKNHLVTGYVEYISNGTWPGAMGALRATETNDCNEFEVEGTLIGQEWHGLTNGE